MTTATKLAIPLGIATVLTVSAMLITAATAAPQGARSDPTKKGDQTVTAGADNFYKSDKVTVETVTFKTSTG